MPVVDSYRCVCCGKPLTKEDIAMTKKMVNRGAAEYCCLPCLAEHFQVTEEILRQKMAEFKAMGCTLFD